ncbi:non-ribosomal peptide synthetase, partial [Microbacterium sp. 18062]|uniref:non-ribosomal peptide synthetase n=1 Tax=Microbacterium sp. 18062 TaxID=2681410 RepID=UPI00135B8924
MDIADLQKRWNDRTSPTDTATVPELFASAVRSAPDAPALVDGDRLLTYGELSARVSQLAHALRRRGLAAEDTVGICLPRSAEMVVAVLAVMVAGGAFVPVDPEWPAARRAQVMADASARFALVAEGGPEQPAAEPVVVSLDDWRFGQLPSEPPHITIANGQLAYVIFTSGSTGTPKGAMIRHEAICERLMWQRDHVLLFGPDDASLFKAPLAFDISVNEILLPLISGGRVVIAAPGQEKDPDYLLDLIAGERVTYLYLVSSMLDALLVLDRERGVSALGGVRHVWCGGEVLTPRLFEQFRKQLSTTLYHGYGPAEATIGVSHVVYRDTAERIATSIGRPNPHTQLYVLDETLSPTPVGVGGELYAAGFLLGRGYVGNPLLTASAFVANPFAPDGSRLYRTGDLARWTEDGTLEFLGRADNQVKIRGRRVELEEIEVAVSRHPQVRQAAVVLRKGDAGVETLVGYVTETPGAALDVDALRRWCLEQLPDYMVPTTLIVLDAFPVTANGKVDRRALPEPAEVRQGEAVAPKTPTETLLCGIFESVLGVEEVGVDDDFFAVGGDSILLIQVVIRARRAGITVTTAEVLAARTIATLATLIDQRTREEAVDVVHVPETSSSALWPIAAAHVGLPGFEAFTQSFVFTTPSGLDEDVLRHAMERVVGHHPVLSGRLTRDETDRWCFAIPRTAPASAGDRLRTERVTGPWSAAEWVERAEKTTGELSESLDLETGVLWRAVWFTTEAESTGRLLLVIHHLVVDGVSWRIIGDDLRHAWELETGATTEPLLPAGTSMTAWSAALASRAHDEDIASQWGYWTETISGEEPLLGSRGLDTAQDTRATSGSVRVTVPEDVTRAILTDVPQALTAEVNDVLLGALTAAVGAWRSRHGVDHRRVLIGLEGHGREESLVPGSDLSSTVGWFTSWYPVALSTDDIDPALAVVDPSAAADAVLRVKEHLRTVPGKGLGYGLLRHLRPESVEALVSGNMPQIGFNYLGQFGGVDARDVRAWATAPELPGIGGHAPEALRIPAAIDINVAAVPSGDGPVLEGTFAFASGIVDKTDVRELVTLWQAALTTLSAHSRTTSTTRHSPSDLTVSGVPQGDLDGWASRYGEFVDAYPLAPLQRGIVFESLIGGGEGGVDVYVTQTILHVEGALVPGRLRDAFVRVLERFPNLKAAITTTGSGEHVAVIPASVTIPFSVTDATNAPNPDEAARSVADRDRTIPFDLEAAPLMRVNLVTTSSTTHAVVLTMHHVLADGWSVPVLARALLDAYRTPTTPVIPDRVFPAFLTWLDDRDESASLQQWERTLSAVEEPTLVAPSSPAASTAFPEEVLFESAEAQSGALHATAREAGVTLSSLVQTAWGMFLNTVTGQGTVVFGTTVSGRPADIDGIEGAVGLFINTIPTPIALDGNPTLRDLVRRVQNQNARLLDHHHTPLAKLHRVTGVDRLFDTLVVYENYPFDEQALVARHEAGVAFSDLEIRDSTHYPLTLGVFPEASRIRFRLSYATDLFDPATVARFVGVFRRVLEAIASFPDERVSGLDLLPADDGRAVAEWSSGSVRDVPVTTLDGLIRARAAVSSDGMAVVDDATGVAWSFAGFDARVNALAGLLAGRGVGVGDRVGVLLPRSGDLVVTLIAVIRAGAAYVPIDPDYPAERIGQILQDATVGVVVTDTATGAAHAGVLDTAGADTIRLDDEAVRAVLDAGAPDAPVLSRALAPQDAAYVLFTSGTTGRPKGVAVSHEAIVNRLAWVRDDYGVGPADRVLQKTPDTFDVSVWEFFLPLVTGASVVVARDGGHKDPDYLADVIRRQRVTVAHFVPSMLQAFLASGPDPDTVSSVRCVFFSGEALPAAAAIAADRLFTNAGLHNLYGPTEAAVDVTAHPVDPVALTDAAVVPIGAPVANTVVRVLDGWLRPVGPGVPGELYLGGVQLADGYVGRFALTAERFVADP